MKKMCLSREMGSFDQIRKQACVNKKEHQEHLCIGK